MRIRKNLLLSVIIPVMLVSCQNIKNKQDLGTILGGGLGGFLGNQFAPEKNKEGWTIIGGILGALIGNKIGEGLDEEDRKKHIVATEKALYTGKPQIWKSPEKKTSGTIKVVKTVTKKEEVKIPVLKGKIKKIPPLDVIDRPYLPKKTINLRGGPGTDYIKVGSLSAKKPVNVVGKVKNKSWYFVSENGVGNGFAYAPLMSSAQVQVKETNKTSSVDSEEQTVLISKKCRTLEESLTLANGKKVNKSFEACQGTSGWEIKT